MQTTTQQHAPSLAEFGAHQASTSVMTRSVDLRPLEEFVDLNSLLPLVQHTFPTKDSIRWFVRLHKESLAKAGALISITGRLRFHPDLFQRVAVEIGRAAAGGAAQ